MGKRLNLKLRTPILRMLSSILLIDEVFPLFAVTMGTRGEVARQGGRFAHSRECPLMR
jgi:hypothetical protein